MYSTPQLLILYIPKCLYLKKTEFSYCQMLIKISNLFFFFFILFTSVLLQKQLPSKKWKILFLVDVFSEQVLPLALKLTLMEIIVIK